MAFACDLPSLSRGRLSACNKSARDAATADGLPPTGAREMGLIQQPARTSVVLTLTASTVLPGPSNGVP